MRCFYCGETDKPGSNEHVPSQFLGSREAYDSAIERMLREQDWSEAAIDRLRQS